MQGPSSYGVTISITEKDGREIYRGDAIYRPGKAHPATGQPVPMIGVPDDSKPVRPSSTVTYVISIGDDELQAAGVYLERVSTCWWFILNREPAGLLGDER
jgi:hypothetical protein